VIERLMAAAAFVSVPVAVRLLPWTATMRLCDAWPRSAGRRASAPVLAHRVDRWMARTAGFWRAGCLDRALVLYVMLRQHGHAPRLHIGARGTSVRFQAHAWVSLGGAPVAEPDAGTTHRELVHHGA
jgi:hypothetical protein